jgi:hypothetical protein
MLARDSTVIRSIEVLSAGHDDAEAGSSRCRAKARVPGQRVPRRMRVVHNMIRGHGGGANA